MSTLRIRVSVTPAIITVDKLDYQEKWDEHCDENADGEDDAPSAAGTEPPDDFVLECVQEELETGDRDLGEAFESAAIGAEIVR